jgi:hypothetical protein
MRETATAAAADEEESMSMRVEIAEKPEHWRAIDGFLSSERANELRGVFDARMEDPLRVDPERFVWDYWHVPNQYTLLRTPAEDYFGETLYRELEDALLAYGKNELGCSSITPVWMSCYVHGMRQTRTESFSFAVVRRK